GSRTYVVTRCGAKMTAKPAVEERAREERARSADGVKPARRKRRGSGGSRRTGEKRAAVAEPAEPDETPKRREPPREREPEPPPKRAERSANVWSAATELGLDSDG